MICFASLATPTHLSPRQTEQMARCPDCVVGRINTFPKASLSNYIQFSTVYVRTVGVVLMLPKPVNVRPRVRGGGLCSHGLAGPPSGDTVLGACSGLPATRPPLRPPSQTEVPLLDSATCLWGPVVRPPPRAGLAPSRAQGASDERKRGGHGLTGCPARQLIRASGLTRLKD